MSDLSKMGAGEASQYLINPDVIVEPNLKLESKLINQYIDLGKNVFKFKGPDLCDFFEKNWEAYENRYTAHQKCHFLSQGIKSKRENLYKNWTLLNKEKERLNFEFENLKTMFENQSEFDTRKKQYFCDMEEMLILESKVHKNDIDLQKLKQEERFALYQKELADSEAVRVMQIFVDRRKIRDSVSTETTECSVKQTDVQESNVVCIDRKDERNGERTLEKVEKPNVKVKQNEKVREQIIIEMNIIDEFKDTDRHRDRKKQIDRRDDVEKLQSSTTTQVDLRKQKTGRCATDKEKKSSHSNRYKEFDFKIKKNQMTIDLRKMTLKAKPPDTYCEFYQRGYLNDVIENDVDYSNVNKWSKPCSKSRWKEKCMERNWRDNVEENCELCTKKLWSDLCKIQSKCLKCCANRL